MATSVTQDQIREIEQSIAQALIDGVSTVTIDGNSVTLEAADARLEALRKLAAQVSTASGKVT